MDTQTTWCGHYAARCAELILPLPEYVSVAERCLSGLTEADFRETLNEIHECFRRFFTEMAKAPEHFGMPEIPLEIESGQSRTTAPLYRLVKFLRAMCSMVNDEKAAIVMPRETVGKLKVRGLTSVLERLRERGFAVAETAEELVMVHENPKFMQVFAACGFDCLRWTSLAADAKAQSQVVDFMAATLVTPGFRELFYIMHAYLVERGLNYTVQYQDNNLLGGYKVRYKLGSRPEFAVFCYDHGDEAVKLRLGNMHEYEQMLGELPAQVLRCILRGMRCTNCSDCRIKFRFSHDSEEYVKCSRGNYYFRGMTPEHWAALKALIDAELPFYRESRNC